MSKLYELIAEQQKGHENEPIFMIGEQLKEIAEKEPASAELIEKDLLVYGMGLKDVAKRFEEYAGKNRKGARCFCITPKVAEKIIREFYGLPSMEEKTDKSSEAPKPVETNYIDLSSFL